MNAIKFIKNNGVDKAREVVEGAPIGCTHYRALSCGIRYTKHISISECYIWNGIMWRTCSAPYLVFTSDVIYPISYIKRLVESVDYVSIYGYEKSKDILKNAPVGAEYYSWLIGNSGIRDKTVDLVKLKQAIADYELIYEVK